MYVGCELLKKSIFGGDKGWKLWDILPNYIFDFFSKFFKWLNRADFLLHFTEQNNQLEIIGNLTINQQSFICLKVRSKQDLLPKKNSKFKKHKKLMKLTIPRLKHSHISLHCLNCVKNQEEQSLNVKLISQENSKFLRYFPRWIIYKSWNTFDFYMWY